ncbi:MAG: hypothetical protein IKQ41_07725 [Clostridia bacterium]|nr:hypothetical protein [Clostridia bacterium]
MMYRKSQPHLQASMADLRFHRRVLLIACIILLAATAFLTVTLIRGQYTQDKARDQLTQRMYSACASAIDEVNKIGGITSSGTAAQLARARQYIFYMEQLNAMSVSMYGESGRMAQADAFTVLYADLDDFEKLVQQSTSSTIDIRTLLLTHLRAVQAYLPQQ